MKLDAAEWPLSVTHLDQRLCLDELKNKETGNWGRDKRFNFFFYTWIRFFLCMFVTTAMLYLFIGLAGCSVNPMISRCTRKLARTPQVIKKNKKKIKET